MLAGHTWLLVIISLLAILIIGYVYCNISHKKYTVLRICLALILGGALGNLIDRIRLKYVVDYLYFKLIDFPVFNFADICVTVPIALMVILCVFKYSGNDFDVIMGEKLIDEKPGFVRAMWCGEQECEDQIKADTTATSRCMPFENNDPITDKCICCGKPAKHLVIWGKAY